MADIKMYDIYYNNPNQIQMYYGLSTYTKPTTGIPVGMEYRETDTMSTYTWDGTEWKSGSFGGGSGESGGGSLTWSTIQW
jgi:uncharacterized membrane protein YgcG